MIEVKHLFKRYEGGEAVYDVNFSVNKGEVCAAVGLEGSGKTTLADVVTGCIEPDQGSVLICGIDISRQAVEAKQHLGYVPAEGGLYRDMTLRAGMKFVADAVGMSNREAVEKIDAAIRRFHLKDVADIQTKNLSAGAFKLAALAQASFFEPEVIVIDEPTAGLNPREILEVREAIRELKADHAVLLCSRSLSEVCAVADWALVLHEGRILAQGTPNELHRLTTKDGTLRVVVRCGEETARKAFENVGASVEAHTLTEEEATEVILSANGADLRKAAFDAVCASGVELLYFGLVEKPLDELLKGMDSERIVYTPTKEGSGDEGNL